MKKIALKVTSAFLVDGKIAKVGEVVEVEEIDAKSLLHRGKAVLAVVEAEHPQGMKPAGVVLTEGDAAADLAGEPRPDHQGESSYAPADAVQKAVRPADEPSPVERTDKRGKKGK